MPKAKKTKQQNSGPPKCTCDDPFKCSCGNRPERPSRGHKWYPETQEWAGKGHKQKGGSGQTSSVAQAAKTTAIGGTQIAQWQRLPSTLLQEVCQKQKRPLPKYKNIEKKDKQYLYRVIVPDPKRDSEKDLFFVPARAVGNEEQAKEEAAILALLELTPNIPHERKLPEPYKTTWQHAVKNKKASASKVAERKTPGSKEENGFEKETDQHSRPQTSGVQAPGAQASSALFMAKSYTSKAEQRQQREERQRERNAKIRHHEAIRMANQNHPVFLSARIREQIQRLLRGDFNVEDLNDGDSDTDVDKEVDELSEVQLYVEERLHNEGFTKRQARKGFKQTVTTTNISEDQWDSVYENCLQWLCIHLDEDQLPEGFDPRGGTLDVIVPTSGTKANTSATSETGSRAIGEADVISLANKYAITRKEAYLVLEKANKERILPEDVLWRAFKTLANVSLDCDKTSDVDQKEVVEEEIEVLQAMFPSECKLEKIDESLLIKIILAKFESELQITVRDGMYPAEFPTRVLISTTNTLNGASTTIHIEIVKFVATLPLDSPMVYEIYSFVEGLLETAVEGGLEFTSLAPALDHNQKSSKEGKSIDPKKTVAEESSIIRSLKKKKLHRPRERSAFWSTAAGITPPAIPSPGISQSMLKCRKDLPAYRARSDFLKLLNKPEGGRVVLVTGDTGCGKTTQIPQFILEEQPNRAKIVVTQPRRLAATGVASRVANERGEDRPGKDSVGYVVRGDSAVCKNTRLLFCTTGVLLRQLQSEGALENITHIVVDEVHERQLDTDILLGLLKDSLKDYSHLKVVLMSATLDADRFAAYWGKNTPRIHIPGRTFPVQDFMLEDVLSITGYIPSKKKGRNNYQGFKSSQNQSKGRSTPWADSEKSDNEDDDEDEGGCLNQEVSQTLVDATQNSNGPHSSIPLEELVARVDQANVDYDLLAQLVKHLILKKVPNNDGSILVFLAGAPEIHAAMEAIRRILKSMPILVLPLHGGLQPKEQRLVFQEANRGFTKVILSTNVAETSITIPDCTIVIDACREKVSSYEPSNRMPLLVEQFASKASLKQRRGRAGRVREGVCYKLISHSTYKSLKDHGEPEIRRCALDQVLLSLLFLGVEKGRGTFLNTLMDPPNEESVDAAIFSLRKLGALETSISVSGEVSLTPLGMHLAGIPAPPAIGKLLVMGSILGCRKAALAMAGGMTTGRSPFLNIQNRRSNRTNTNRNGNEDLESMEEMKNKLVLQERAALFSTVGNSDHAMLAAIFVKWEKTSTGGGERKRFCESLGLSFTGMKDIEQLVKQLDSSLRASGYDSSVESDRNMNSWRIIRSCAVAALAPSQLVRVQRPSAKYFATVEGATEKDAEARELKFFIRSSLDQNQHQQQPPSTGGAAVQGNNGPPRPQEERVFLHPSSANFKVGSYSCPWLVYHSLVRTSKAFLRDASECSAYALLLFGGKLDVQAEKGVVCVDDWVQLSAKARIGSLIGGLRQKVDELLAKKIEDPSFDLAGTREMQLIVKLLVTDGLGN